MGNICSNFRPFAIIKENKKGKNERQQSDTRARAKYRTAPKILLFG